MHFCYLLKNDFAEVVLVYQQVLSPNTLSDLSIPSQQMKKKQTRNQSLIICCTCFCHLQRHKKRHRRK